VSPRTIAPAPTSTPQSLVSAGARRWMDMTEEERRAQLDQTSSTTGLPERLVQMSERFLGTPYAVSPLGEGSGKDPDPLIRFDAVDCLTFVEETIALGLSSSWEEVERLLTLIRYAGEPVYAQRNHLMEAQWIPNNIQKGFLTTATRRYGGDLTHRVWKEINQRTWASNRSRQLGLTGAERPMGKYALSMVDLQNAPAIAPRVVSGTILAIVREDRAFSVTRVSHVGFVIQKGRRTYLRHATRTFGKVVDEDLKTFLARNLKYDKWKVVGISLYDVAAPPAGSPIPAPGIAKP
jgi:hypothetical protein